ncbi:MAG: ABC transporter ATP-binding protein, partial [Chloroflexi bacterium]|nr:ABC transporter ATP-binding protein [Chloroflexota bacterium]
GPNGAGKTTMTRLMAAMLSPTAGRITVAGYDTVGEPDGVRSVVGLLTETPGLYERMTAYDYLDFFGQLRGIEDEARKRRIRELIDVFELAEQQHEHVGKYSKGMRQKVGLMRSLLHDPPVLFLDEPTSALDPRSAKIVREYIMGLRRADRTIVWCTHYLTEAEAMAETIAIVGRGQIVAYGTRDELQARLSGLVRFRLHIEGPIAPYLGALDGLVEADESGYNWVSYATREPRGTNPAVVGRLVAVGAQIVALSELGSSLEDVYLRLIGDQVNNS